MTLNNKYVLKSVFSVFFMLMVFSGVVCQNLFTQADSLRGSITPERDWWDLKYYHLDIHVNPNDSSIHGSTTIKYKVLSPHQKMQIDLQPPLQIVSATQGDNKLEIESVGNAHFLKLNKKQIVGNVESVVVNYEGKPHVAIRAPWDGGFSFAKDSEGNDFIATSCQGIGASIWWPCKDHPSDEPDSMLISVTNPDHLQNISNGRLRSVQDNGNGTVTSHWFVNSPISNYVVNVNIGHYVHTHEIYLGEGGPLDLDIYVLKENEKYLKRQLLETRRMLKALEYWFGPYPFYEDGYKLVEVPYLGMEHQSSITYGNGYINGYRGTDLSGSGWGLLFDFIIVHESGHEWFANNITYKDVADMWIHESFTNYSESLFLDYHYGRKASSEYCLGTRSRISNDRPIIGIYGVNKRGSGDMYYKGGNMIHTLRQVLNDDEAFRHILRGLNDAFHHQTVESWQIEDYIARHAKMDLSGFFDQYLRDTRIPILEMKKMGENWHYRWSNVNSRFNIPIDLDFGSKTKRIYPTSTWKTEVFPSDDFEADPDYYVEFKVTVE